MSGTPVTRRAVLMGTVLGVCSCGIGEGAEGGTTGEPLVRNRPPAATVPASTVPASTVKTTSAASPALPGVVGVPREELAARAQAAATELAGRRPAWFGLRGPGIIERIPADAVALTFDACGGPNGAGVDERLLATLAELDIRATLFLNARWVVANRSVVDRLRAEGRHLLVSHGFTHRPMSCNGAAAYGIAGTADLAQAALEVVGGSNGLLDAGVPSPAFFRSGTAHYDDVCVELIGRCGLRVAGYSVNADGGSTFTAGAVARELATVTPGDIVIAHMNRPGSGTAAGFAQALPAMVSSGLRFVRLDDPSIRWA